MITSTIADDNDASKQSDSLDIISTEIVPVHKSAEPVSEASSELDSSPKVINSPSPRSLSPTNVSITTTNLKSREVSEESTVESSSSSQSTNYHAFEVESGQRPSTGWKSKMCDCFCRCRSHKRRPCPSRQQDDDIPLLHSEDHAESNGRHRSQSPQGRSDVTVMFKSLDKEARTRSMLDMSKSQVLHISQ